MNYSYKSLTGKSLFRLTFTGSICRTNSTKSKSKKLKVFLGLTEQGVEEVRSIETYASLFQQCQICEFFYIKGFFIQNNIFNDLNNKSITINSDNSNNRGDNDNKNKRYGK